MRMLLSLILLLSLVPGRASLPSSVLIVPDSLTTLLIAVADESRLYEYQRRPDGTFTRQSAYVSVGSNGVGKQRERDRRTPLGLYFVDDILNVRHLDPFYGDAAFSLDYPNARDRHLGRTGGGIWIHGVPPGSTRRPARDTDGCLALGNEDLLELAPRIEPQRTAVLIVRTLETPGDARHQHEALEVRTAVDDWVDSRRRGRLDRLMALYADDFEYRGLERDAFADLLAAELTDPDVTDVRIGSLLAVSDPEEPGIVVTRFRLTIERPSSTVTRWHRLYWKQQGGRFRIVVEDEA